VIFAFRFDCPGVQSDLSVHAATFDWIVIAPTVAYVLLVAFALWVALRALTRQRDAQPSPAREAVPMVMSGFAYRNVMELPAADHSGLEARELHHLAPTSRFPRRGVCRSRRAIRVSTVPPKIGKSRLHLGIGRERR